MHSALPPSTKKKGSATRYDCEFGYLDANLGALVNVAARYADFRVAGEAYAARGVVTMEFNLFVKVTESACACIYYSLSTGIQTAHPRLYHC